MAHKQTLVFDFDGVLSQSPEYHWPLERTDFDLLAQAIDAGYAVAVSTCNTVGLVADALDAAGFTVHRDLTCRYDYWTERGVVLVTNRKVSGVIIDDKCINWRFGGSFAELMTGVAEVTRQREAALKLTARNRMLDRMDRQAQR